ncbi:hypothetical protein HW555_006724, partial [Spodoptera exigua]
QNTGKYEAPTKQTCPTCDCDLAEHNSFLSNDMISFFSKLSLNNSQKPPVELAKPAYMDKSATLQELGYRDENDLKETIYDFLRTIRDPEKPSTLEDLK